MSKLSERQRLILTIAVGVLIIGGLLALILKDRTEISATNEEIATLQARIRGAEVEIRKTRSREDQILVYRAVENRELEVLPTKQEIANFHRDLSTFLSQAGLTFRELPESTPVESGLAKGIFVTRTDLTCQGESDSLLKFLNMVENDERLVAVKGLQVKAANARQRDLTSVRNHEFEVNLETYFYNPSSKSLCRNQIPGEEARLQESRIRDAIASFRPEQPDRYVLRPAAGRRDPMVDPRCARPILDPVELAEAWKREENVVLDLEHRVDEIYEKVEQANAHREVGDLFRFDHIMREIDGQLNEVRAQLAHVEQMKKVVIPELAVRLESVRSRLDDVQQSRPPREIEVTRGVAEGMLKEIQAAFRAGKYDEAIALCVQWALYTDGKAVVPEARDVVALIETIRSRARVLSEFESMVWRVTGTIVHPVDPKRSVALINGRSCHVGDRLADGGEVIVGEITRDGVEFLFKGETIRIERQSAGSAAKPSSTRRGTHVGAVPASTSARR